MPKETLLEFPCAFPIKTFGKDKDTEDFKQVVYELVKPHVPELSAQDLVQKMSSGGRYLAVTVNITAQNQAQLDAIYQSLGASPAVIMSL